MAPGRHREGWQRVRRGGWQGGSADASRRGPPAGADWLAKIGWRLPGGDERLDAVAFEASAIALSAARRWQPGRASPRSPPTGSRGPGASTTSGWATARRSAMRAPKRVADHAGGVRVEPANDRGQVVRGALDAQRRGSAATPVDRGPAGRRRRRGTPGAKAVGVGAPARAAPGEAVEQQQRPAGRRGRGPPSGGRRRGRRSRPRRRGDDRGDLPMERDVPRTVRSQLQHLDSGHPIDRSTSSRRSPGSDPDVLPAQRGHDRGDIDPVGRPEQLLVSVRQAGRRDRGAAPGEGTRRCRRRRC